MMRMRCEALQIGLVRGVIVGGVPCLARLPFFSFRGQLCAQCPTPNESAGQFFLHPGTCLAFIGAAGAGVSAVPESWFLCDFDGQQYESVCDLTEHPLLGAFEASALRVGACECSSSPYIDREGPFFGVPASATRSCAFARVLCFLGWFSGARLGTV